MEKFEAVLKDAGVNDRLTLIKVRYAMEIMKNEAIKLVILAVLFILLGRQIEFILAAAFLMPVRVFSGGMHMKSNIGCFVFSLMFFLLSVIALPKIPSPAVVLFMILAVSAILIAALSPVASYKRPIKTTARRVSLKKKTIVILAINCAVLIILWRFDIHDFFVIGVWVVTLQAIQLLAVWIFRKVKGVKNVGENQEMETAAGRGAGY